MVDRILSLVPSATEIIAALGFERSLVGRTHECDYPPSVLGMPIVTQSRIDAAASSGEIDQAVRAMAAANQSLFILDEKKIRALAPTLIITQGLCPVCAVDDRDVCRIAAQLPHSPTIFRMQPMTLDNVFDDIANIAAVLQCQPIAARFLRSLKKRVSECVIRGSLQARPRRILLLEWLDPFFSAGHWNPQLIELAGGEAVLARTGALSQAITLDDIHDADPDFIVIAPCGFSLERALREASTLRAVEGWERLRAVQTGQTYVTDGAHYFNRPGPRLVDSLELLGHLIVTSEQPQSKRSAVHACWVASEAVVE